MASKGILFKRIGGGIQGGVGGDEGLAFIACVLCLVGIGVVCHIGVEVLCHAGVGSKVLRCAAGKAVCLLRWGRA